MRPSLQRRLFPDPPRGFRGQRWLNVSLRSLHLVGIAGIGGGFLFDQAPETWAAYWHLTVISGVALTALYLWGSVGWLFELKGLSIVVKTLLLGVALLVPSLRAELFLLLIVLSALIAHAPGAVRGYRWLRLPFAAVPAPDNPPPDRRRTN
jgi:hypothetical protein